MDFLNDSQGAADANYLETGSKAICNAGLQSYGESRSDRRRDKPRVEADAMDPGHCSDWRFLMAAVRGWTVCCIATSIYEKMHERESRLHVDEIKSW